MCLSYIGGKSKIAKSFIEPKIPRDIEVYVEPFSGMFWTFFAFNLENFPNLKTVVYNDFNPLNVNLFRCLQHPEVLLEACEKVPVQKKGVFPTPPECAKFFKESQKNIYSSDFVLTDEPNYEVGAKHALVLSSVFSGANPEKSNYIDLKGKYNSKFTAFMNKLKNPKWLSLFRSINFVENNDFQKAVEKWDSPKTYFYCDPPYYIVGEGNYYSNHSFTREDHERLANSLKSIQGKFSLSYYYFEQLSQWFPKETYNWSRKEFPKAAMAKAGQKQTTAVELLIMNY